jgi:Mrp family chromosome partitioning ATPase
MESHAVAKLHHLEPLPAADGPARMAAPLDFGYTVTRIAPELRARMHMIHGVAHGGRSPLSEAYKVLRGQVQQRLDAQGASLVAVTSPRAVDGKSLAALNLALAIAADHDRTALLIDADLSGVGLQRMLGLGDAHGLADHLRDATPLTGLLVNPGIARLVLLPGGRAASDSAELLAARACAEAMREIKHRYRDRVIVVDLPPLLEAADALAFLPHADAVLLVLEEGTTRWPDVDEATELLAPYRLLGSVLSRGRARDELAGHEGRRRWWQRGLRAR